MGKVGCPLSLKTTNTVAARLNAAIVVVLVGISLWWRQPWIPALLALDFFWIGFLGHPSPRAGFSGWIVKKFGAGRKINAGPKIFAAKIGFWVSLLVTIAATFEQWQTYWILAEILMIAAGLEAAFEFCLGCKVFPHWHRATRWFRK